MISMIVSLILGLLGGFFLLRGKKTQNVSMMLVGGLLIVLSYWLF
jgi:hypothetical protein